MKAVVADAGDVPSECKKLYIARYGLTARQFNAIAYELKGRVKAAEKARRHRIGTLRDQIAATEKAICRLQKQDRALASGKGKAPASCSVLSFTWWRMAMPPTPNGGRSGGRSVPAPSSASGRRARPAGTSASQALSYRFVRKDGTWYVHVTRQRPATQGVTRRQAGALGVDLNPDRVAVAGVDRFGNPVAVRDIPVPVEGRRNEQVRAALGDAVADVVAWARTSGKPYATFHALIVSRAAREGVEVVEVNPAYTSLIGKVKFEGRYGLSPHGAAAVAIARRGLKFGERLRSGNAVPLPGRNRGRHVWSDWSRLLPRVRGRKPTHALYPWPSEGGPGRGVPLSASAPAGRGPHGPGRHGRAWVPGRDGPQRIAGSTVRPAS